MQFWQNNSCKFSDKYRFTYMYEKVIFHLLNNVFLMLISNPISFLPALFSFQSFYWYFYEKNTAVDYTAHTYIVCFMSTILDLIRYKHSSPSNPPELELNSSRPCLLKAPIGLYRTISLSFMNLTRHMILLQVPRTRDTFIPQRKLIGMSKSNNLKTRDDW